MATFKAIIGQLRADNTHAIRIRVTQDRQLAYIPTDCYVHKDFVRNSKRTGQTITDHRILDKIDFLIRRYMKICDENDTRGLDAKGIVALIKSQGKNDVMETDFVSFVRTEAEKMKSNGRVGSAKTRITAINAFCEAFGRQTIPLSSLTKRAVRDAFRHIKGTRAPSLYKAQLQASYNTLMKEHNIDAQVIPFNPFSGLEVPKPESPKKRALTIEQIKAIYNLPDMKLREGTKGRRFNLAKDAFMLSFFLVGMNAVDLFNCTDYEDGVITYERTKTRTRRSDKALMSITVPEIAKPLFDKYYDGRKRVFRFYKLYADSGTFNAGLNKGLNQVGKVLGIENLTFYAARHSWATIAVNECEIDKWTVHLALNHVDPSTAVTDIYIKKSWKPVDDANAKVLERMFGEK